MPLKIISVLVCGNAGLLPLYYSFQRRGIRKNAATDHTALVEDIFNQAVRLRNPTAVAHYINKLGGRTRKRTLVRRDGTTRTVGEKRFTGYRVFALISNPLYKGMIEHNGQEYPAVASVSVYPRNSRSPSESAQRQAMPRSESIPSM